MRKGIFAALLLLAVAAICGLALAQSTDKSEFTPEQRRFLEEQMPRGHFSTDSTFRNCEGHRWVVYESDGDWYPLMGQCWLDRLPVYPGLLPSN